MCLISFQLSAVLSEFNLQLTQKAPTAFKLFVHSLSCPFSYFSLLYLFKNARIISHNYVKLLVQIVSQKSLFFSKWHLAIPILSSYLKMFIFLIPTHVLRLLELWGDLLFEIDR